MNKLIGLFGKIETIKAKAAFVHSELSGGSITGAGMGGAGVLSKIGMGGGAQGPQNMAGGYDDSNKNSLISDIKNYFTKSVRPGMQPGSQAN